MALPGANAVSSIALRVTETTNPTLHDKVVVIEDKQYFLKKFAWIFAK
jgi:hypothetical protein